jgi:hypothetical protein
MGTKHTEPLLAIGIYKTAHDEPTYCIAFVGYKGGNMTLLAEPRYQRNSMDRSVFQSEQGIYTIAKQAEKQLPDGDGGLILAYSEPGMGTTNIFTVLIKLSAIFNGVIRMFLDIELTENQGIAFGLSDKAQILLSSQPEVAAVTAAVLALQGELISNEDSI